MAFRPSSTSLHLAQPVLAALAAVTMGATGACSSDSDGGGGGAASGAPTARFALTAGTTPDFLDVPFPSDVYLDATGHFVDPMPNVARFFSINGDLVSKQLARVNGWSRIAPALFPIDDNDPAKETTDTDERPGAEVDRSTLPADEDACVTDTSSVYLVDLEPADPSAARVPCRALLLDERNLTSERTTLGVGPARGIVLQEGHHYAAVVTNRVHAKDASGAGVPLAATDAFGKAIADAGGVYGAAYAKVTATLASALADGTKVVALAPYTTQKVKDELYALHDQLDAGPAATLAWDEASMAPMGAVKFAKVAPDGGTLPAGFTASLDDWLGVATKKLDDGSDDPDETLAIRAHDKMAAVGTAVFQAVNYMQHKPGGYDDIDHENFARDGAGNVIPAPDAPTSKIWATFIVPDAPMPAAGYPAVIVQHGLGGSRDYIFALANRFASKGWITVGIDSVTFGARAPEAQFQVDAETTLKGGTYEGPDGLADRVSGEFNGSFDFFGSLKNLGALRDHFRQAELDTAQLVKVLRSKPDLSPLKTGTDAPAIDPDEIAYFGDSLGGIEGAGAAAIEPNVKAWVLNVAGAGVVTELAAHGPAINTNIALAGSVNFGIRGTVFTEAHPMVALIQAMVEAGDPIAYAADIVTTPHAGSAPRNVLQTEVVYDELVANEAGEALARAGGWGMTAPNVGPNAGVFDFTSKPYPGGGIKLDLLPASADGYHDTPKAGVTAVVVQLSPATHSDNATTSHSGRSYAIPYNTADGVLVSNRSNAPFTVPCHYREVQDSVIGFLADAFDGKVPVVKGMPTPVRDADGDGKPDDADPDPIDASK